MPWFGHRRRQGFEQHCNFLINTGTATAADLEALGEEVRRRVLAETGVVLSWEIHRVGVPAGMAFGSLRNEQAVAVLMGGWSSERQGRWSRPLQRALEERLRRARSTSGAIRSTCRG